MEVGVRQLTQQRIHSEMRLRRRTPKLLALMAQLLKQPKPVYPPLAKAARVQGTVKFQATIGKDGTIQNLQMLSGPPLLVQAAMQAVQQWTYGRAQYDKIRQGDWSAAPVSSRHGPWSSDFTATLPPWSVNVFIFDN